MDTKAVVVEALRQLMEGDDFSSPPGLLRSIKADDAVRIPTGAPYSIATNVRHAAIWQNAWLARLKGEAPHRIPPGSDFPDVPADEWKNVRTDFIDGLTQARTLAEGWSGDMDEEAVRRFMKIVNHGAYHVGQVQLLKRLLK